MCVFYFSENARKSLELAIATAKNTQYAVQTSWAYEYFETW